MEPRRELLNEMGYEDLVVFENPSYDSAIVGVNEDQTRVVYDFEKMVGYLMENDDMEYEDAVEFIMACASAVQVGTNTFANPNTMIEVIDGLAAFRKRKGYHNIEEMRGIIQK